MGHGSRAALIWSVVSLACNTTPPHQNPFDPGTPSSGQAKATLSGTVALEAGGKASSPLGVHVVLTGTGLSADADAGGAWSIAGVTAGSYTMQASLAGYETQIVPGILVSLADGDKVVAVPDALLKVARGSVVGTIHLEGESQHAGVTVALQGVQGSVQTDANGAYALQGVASGTYTLTASKVGFQDGSVAAIAVDGGKAAQVADLTLAALPGSIEGSVAVTGAVSAAGVNVSADGLTLSGNHHVASAVTGASGSFTLSSIPAGTYTITYSLANYVGQSTSATVAPSAVSTLPAVRLSPETGGLKGTVLLEGSGSSLGIDVALTPHATAANPTPLIAAATSTDASGNWSVDNLAVGDYDVAYSHTGYVSAVEAVTVVARAQTAAGAQTLAAIPTIVRGVVSREGSTDQSGVAVQVEGTTVSTVSIAGGVFTITGAGTGTQTLVFSMAGYDTQRVPITLAPGDVIDLFPVRLSLSRGTISGTGLLAGMTDHSGIVVSAGGVTTVTDASGAFALAGVLAGSNYTVSLAKPPDWAGATLSVASVTSGATSAAGSATLQPTATAAITGTATLEGGASAAGITVSLSGTDFRGVAVTGANTTTGSGGAYSFSGLRGGTYALSFSKGGYDDVAGIAVAVGSGGSAAAPPAQLPISRGGVSGVVQLAPSIAGSGATVTLSAGATSFTAATDATGAFSFTQVPVGAWSIKASKQPDWLDSTAASVTVSAGATSAAGTILLQPVQSSAVTGAVSLEGTSDASGVLVQLSGSDFRGQAVSTSFTTVSGGAYSFGSLAAGTYQLAFSKASYDSASAAITVATASSNPQPALRLALSRGTIAGTVTLDQMSDSSGIVVTVQGTSITTVTDATGAFQLPGVPIGAGYSVTLARPPDWAPDQFTAVTVTSGTTTTPSPAKTLFPSRSAIISGSVSLEGGATPSGVSVSLSGTDFRGKTVTGLTGQTTGAAGTYTFASLPGGTYTVSLSKSGYDAAAAPAAVSSGGAAGVGAVQLPLSRGGAAGIVQLAGIGTGAWAGTTVRLANGSLSFIATTDSAGAYSFSGVPVGSYTLVAARPPDWSDSAGAAVDIASGASASVSTIALQPKATASVSGSVALEGGGTPSATVTLSGTDFRGVAVTASSLTNVTGSYSFSAIVAGSYQLAFSNALYDNATAAVAVVTGSANSVAAVTLARSRGTIVGKYLLDQLSDATGIVVSVQGTSFTAVTDSTGVFTLSGLPTSSAGYTLNAVKDANWVALSTAAVPVLAGQTTDLRAAAPATITLLANVTAQVSGTATHEDGADPTSILVALSGTDFRGLAVSRSVNPVAGGAFTVSSLPAGNYRLVLSDSGYDSASVAGSVGPSAAVSTGSTVLAVSRGSLSGTVSASPSTVAQSGSNVFLANGSGLVASAVTDAAGNYTFSAIRAHTGYTVAAQRTGYTTDLVSGVEVVAHQNSSVPSLSISPDVTGKIAGAVFQSAGVGLSGVTVDLIGTDLNGQSVSIASAATTDSSGNYQIASLAQGTYTVTYSKSRYQSQTVSGIFLAAGHTAAAPPQAPMEVARASVSGTATLSGTGAGTGTFNVGTDYSGIQVALIINGGLFGQAVTDSSGAYLFSDVPENVAAATYLIKAFKPNFVDQSASFTDLGGSLVADPMVLTLQFASGSGVVVLDDNIDNSGPNLSGAGALVTLSGTAYNNVSYTDSTFSQAAGPLTPEGFWRLGGVPPGTYTVTVTSTNRDCGAAISGPLGHGQVVSGLNFTCVDTLAPGALTFGTSPADTNQTSLDVPLQTASTDATGNFRGYQVTVGLTPDWTSAILIEGQQSALTFPCGSTPLDPNCKPLKSGTNTLWARGIDWKGNGGTASSLQVFYDPDRPLAPSIHLARPFPAATPTSYVNDTTTSVTLAGSEGDATFRSYQTCAVTVNSNSSCPQVTAADPVDFIGPVGSRSCAQPGDFADEPSTFAQSLQQDQLTCLYVRAADSAGNYSHVASALIYSDLEAPGAPSIAPVFEPSSLTVRTSTVDVFLSAPAVDRPTIVDPNPPSQWLGIDYLEVDSGAGFIPLCPQSCKGSTVFDPCGCGCNDPRLRCTNGVLTALRLPVTPGTNTITVRSVDLAGNVGDGASTQVPVAITAPLVTDRNGGSNPVISGSAVVYHAASSEMLLELGSNRVREAGEDPFFVGFGDSNRASIAVGPAGVLAPAQDEGVCSDGVTSPARRLLLRARNSSSGLFQQSDAPAEIACTLWTDPGVHFEDVGVGGTTIAWTQFDEATGVRALHVRVPNPGHTLGETCNPDCPWQEAVLTLGSPGQTQFACPVDGFQYARRHALFAAQIPPPGGAIDVAQQSCSTPIPTIGLTNRTWTMLNAPLAKNDLTQIAPASTFTFTASAAALSADGNRLFYIVDGESAVGQPLGPTVLHICGTDAQGAIDPAGATCVARTFPQPPSGFFSWSAAIDGNHAVAIGNAFGGTLSYITDWNSGLNGQFESDTASGQDDTVSLLAPTTVYRNSPSISSGLLVYAYNINGEHQSLLTLDLTQMSWEQVNPAVDLAFPQIDNTPIPAGVPETAPALLSVSFDGQKLHARTLTTPVVDTTLSGLQSGASFAGKGFDVTGGDMVLVARSNLQNASQGVYTLNMGADGLWFTADDIGPTAIPLVQPPTALPSPVAGGGNALFFTEVTVGTSGEQHPFLIQPLSGSLATPGNTAVDLVKPDGYGISFNQDQPTGGVSRDHAVWIGPQNNNVGQAPNVWVRDFVGTPATEAPPAGCGPGERKASRLVMGTLVDGAPHADQVRLTKVGNHTRMVIYTASIFNGLAGGSIAVVDDGGDGHFDTEDCNPGPGLSNDQILSIIPLYGARPGNTDLVAAGDNISFIAVSPDLGQQLYVANAVSGVVTQQTNFFSPKVNLSMDPTGRAFWSDSVFGVRALFRFQP